MLSVADIFQDEMILQREKPITIWGKGDPHGQVVVTIQGQKVETKIDEKGDWRLTLSPLQTAWSETLTITSHQSHIDLKVAIGEVWLAGGQSNMEYYMRYEKHITEARGDLPQIHLYFYDVPEIAFPEALMAFDFSQMGKWRRATATDIDWFSAVGYYFSKAISESLDCPVGIVGCNWGGTPAQAWMSEETVAELDPETYQAHQKWISEVDQATYWQKQMRSPFNRRGLPFEDIFMENVLPQTLTREEVDALFEGNGDGMDEFANEPQPEKFPSQLYQHMLKRLENVVFRGVIWYQGESNDEPGKQALYESLLTGLIADWRQLFRDALPFYIVQLPGYERWLEYTSQDFPTLRLCQERVTETVEGAYLCSIGDVGEQMDIHPKDKKTVGERLALLARRYTYQQDLLADAPRRVRLVSRSQNQLVLSFDDADGLYIDGQQLNALELLVAGHPISYQAEVVDDQLVLTTKDDLIQGDVVIKFAQTAWYQINLYNGAHIPAFPFYLSV